MIADRRKDQVKASKGRGGKSTKPSNADRSVATGKAKRDATLRARRGMSQSNKPSPMEVEKEVYRQSRKTAVAKKNSEKKASGGRLPPNSSLREKNNKSVGKKKSPPQDASTIAVFGVKTPSKKAVEAAVAGMKSAGIQIPVGHMVSITFVPIVGAAAVGGAGGGPSSSKPDPKGKKKTANQKGGGVGAGGSGADGGNKGPGKKGGGGGNNHGRGYRT